MRIWSTNALMPANKTPLEVEHNAIGARQFQKNISFGMS